MFSENETIALNFHSMGKDPSKGYFGNISESWFRSIIKSVSEDYNAVPHTGLEPSSPKTDVAVTFDDGFQTVYTTALPILEKYDVPATVFVNPDFVGGANRKLLKERHGIHDEGDLMLSEAQLLELIERPLITIGNHTRTHRNLSNIEDEKTLRDEIVRSKSLLEMRYDIKVNSFSYPYGRWNHAAKKIVEREHEYSFTTDPRPVSEGDGNHQLPRIGGHRL